MRPAGGAQREGYPQSFLMGGAMPVEQASLGSSGHTRLTPGPSTAYERTLALQGHGLGRPWSTIIDHFSSENIGSGVMASWRLGVIKIVGQESWHGPWSFVRGPQNDGVMDWVVVVWWWVWSDGVMGGGVIVSGTPKWI